MQFIIGDKLFDTEKAEIVCKFKEARPLWWNKSISTWEDATLYKTNKGNWFSVCKEKCTSLNNEQVKHLLKGLNVVEIYEKYFGKLEEA
ncbi:TPA: hypothetical protein I9085_002447 [Clostridium perfringens]|nr:hypothetical protein [Clostridium perfringens]HAT4343477.1 hypothetical protein [Clostridium perfringens]